MDIIFKENVLFGGNSLEKVILSFIVLKSWGIVFINFYGFFI